MGTVFCNLAPRYNDRMEEGMTPLTTWILLSLKPSGSISLEQSVSYQTIRNGLVLLNDLEMMNIYPFKVHFQWFFILLWIRKKWRAGSGFPLFSLCLISEWKAYGFYKASDARGEAYQTTHTHTQQIIVPYPATEITARKSHHSFYSPAGTVSVTASPYTFHWSPFTQMAISANTHKRSQTQRGCNCSGLPLGGTVDKANQ